MSSSPTIAGAQPNSDDNLYLEFAAPKFLYKETMPELFGDLTIAAGGTEMTQGVRNVGAIYDSFYTDADHRRQIVEQLGLEATNIDLPEFSTHGGGSSFSGVKVTDPTQLDVADRWSHFRDNPYFMILMALLWENEEVRELCFRHFPDSSQILDSFLKTGEASAIRAAS